MPVLCAIITGTSSLSLNRKGCGPALANIITPFCKLRREVLTEEKNIKISAHYFSLYSLTNETRYCKYWMIIDILINICYKKVKDMPLF